MNEDLLLELHKLLGGEEAIPYNQFKNDFNNDEELRGTLHQLIGGDSAITFNDFLGEAGFNPKPTTKKLKVSKINESTQIDWANETVNNIVRLDGTYEDDIVVDLPKVKTIKNEIGKLNKDLESDSKTGLLTTTKRPTPKSKTINGYSWDSGAPVTTTLAAGDYATTQSRDTSVFDRKTPEGVAEAEDRSAQKLQKEDELKTTIALSLQNQDLNSYIQDDVYEDFEGTVAGNGGDDRARYETMLDGADNVKEDIKYVVDYNTNRLNEKYDNYPQYLEDSQFVNTKEKQKQFFLKYADILSDPLTKEIYSLQDKFNEVDPFKAQIKAELFTDPEVKQLYEEKEKANKSREGLREGELTGVPAIDNTIDVLGRNFARLLGRTEQMVGGVASIFDTETGGKLIRRGEDVQELNPKSTKYEGLAEEYIVETDDFEIVFADDNPNSKPQYKRYKDSGLMAPTLGEVENSAVNLNGEIVPVSDIIKGAKRDKRSNLSVYTSMIADAAADLVPQILTTKGMGSALIKAGASTKMAYGLGAAFSGFAQVKGQAMDELLKIKDLTQDQREGISTALGLGTSVITTINPIEAKLASGELSTTIKNYIGKNAVNIANGNISPARIMYDIARAGAFGGIKEVGEESTEQIYEREVVKPIANKLYGASLKEGTTADEWKTLGIISFTVGAFADMAGNIKFDPKSTYQVQALTEVISNPDLYNAYMEGMSKTNPEQAAAITNTIKPIVDEISTLGDEVTTDKKVEIATKMLGAVKLEQDIAKIKNPVLKKQKEEALDNLYKEITNIELSATAKETPKPAKTFVGRDITDTKVFSDFDNTLYNPKTGELTPAGKELQDKLKSGEIKPEDVEILTARTADQAVPISKFFPGVKVNSDLSPEGKAAKVSESTKNTLFIDDNKDNLNAVRNTGKGEVIDSGTITPQVDNEVIKAEEETLVQKTEPSTEREQAPISEQVGKSKTTIISDFKDEKTLPSALEKDNYAILTASQEGPNKTIDVTQNETLKNELIEEFGEDNVEEIKGTYDGVDQGSSFIVTGIPEKRAREIGSKYKQQSILTKEGLIYSETGDISPVKGKVMIGEAAKNQKNQSTITDKNGNEIVFAMDIDTDTIITPSENKAPTATTEPTQASTPTKAEKVAPAAPNEPTKVFTPVKAEDAKLKKSKTRGEDGVIDVVVNGEIIGSMYFDRSQINGWLDSDYTDNGPPDFAGYLGRNKEEAIKEVVDRYNKKQENENKSKDRKEGQVGTTVGEKGSTQEEEKVAGAEDLNTNNSITEKEVETLLEPIGKNSKEREEQIYKFFALPAALGNTEKAREIAKVTNALWENIAKQLGKRSGLNASQWIKSRVAMLGKTTVEDALKRGGKFQVIGEKGAAALDAAQEANTRLDNLATAKEMEAAGKDPKTIKMATGWEKGVDKKWRYEIQDDLEFNDEILSKIDKDGYLIINKLSDVFTFDELFTAFPKLKDIRVVITPSYTKKRDVGMMIATPSFDNKKTLFIYGDNFLQRKSGGTHSFNDIPGIRGKFMAYASHELQHLAANEEGFPRGGTPLDGRRRIEEDIQRLRGTEQGKALEDRYKEDPSGLEDEYYERIAGEVEAQNVEKRLGLTPEQRRQSLLEETEDVAREDQIIIQNSFDGLENAIDNGTVKLQAENNQTLPEAATNVANNLLTELDRMIKEMSNTANIKARGITTTEALKQKKDLQAVRAELLNNMKDPKWQEDAKFRGAAIEVAKGQFIIAALDSPDSSTAVHEFLHTFSPDLTAEEKQVFINEYNSAFGENETEFNRDIEEVAARMWEKYLSNGRQVTESEVSDPKRRGIIQEIFDKFTEYLQGIYNGIIEYTSKGKTREIKISPAVQALFDNIMGITPTATNTTTESGPVTPPAPVTTEKQALDNLKKAALDLFFGNTNVGIAFDPQNAGNLQADRFKAFVDSLVDYIKAKLDNGKYTRAMFNKDMADGKIGVVLEIDKAGVDYLFNKAKPIDPELDNRPTANVEEGDPRLDSDKHKVSGRFTNAGISEILEDFGSTGFGDPTSQSFVAAVNIANDMGYLSPGLESEGLIRDGILEGKGVSEYESVAIMHALMKLHKQMTETRDMINKNEGGNVNHLLAHQEELLAAYELFALAHNRVGTQAGRTLVYRKLAEAYKFDSVLVKERIRKEFSDLGDEQVKTLLDIVDKIDQKTKELQELNANIEEARNKATKQKAAEGVMSIKADKSKPKKDPVKSFKDFFSKNVTPPTVKFQGPSGGASPLDGYSEEEKMNVIKEFARYLVRQEGISSLTKLAERLIEEYDAIKSPGSPSLSVDDIYKALALSSNSEKKAKITEYQKNINKIKSTASRFNKIATLLNGAIPTTNTQKPKPDDLKKLDDLINDLKKIFIMEDFGYTPSESSEIVDDLQKVMDALQAIRMTDSMDDVNAQAQELRKIIGRVNAQMKVNKLQQKLDDIRAGILPDTRVSSVNTIIDAKAFKLKEDIDEARAELKNKIFEARAWQSIMDSPMGKFEFKGFGKEGRFGFRGAVLKYNLQSIRKNWYEYTRRYVLGGDIGTLMLQGGYPTLMMLGKAPLQVLSQNGRQQLSYNYDTIKDLWRTSFTSFFQEFVYNKDSGKPNPSVRMYEEMMHTDNGVYAKQMGLALNRPFAAQLSKSTDEFFVNKGLGDLKSDSSVGKDIISIFDKYEKISEGAYVTGVNSLRLNMFNSFRMMNPTATINELKQYAEFVNTQTGTVPSSSTSGTISKVLLAPRLYWSRIKLITMAPFALNDLRTPEKRLVAKEKLKSLIGFGIGYAMVMQLMALFGYDHEEDPRDSDFLKFKNGAKTIDVSAGIGKFAALLLSIPSYVDMSYNKGVAGDWIAGDHIDMQKLIRGEEGAINLKASKEVDLLDQFNPMTDKPWQIFINRVSFSMHPTIRGVYSMVQGEDAISKPLGASLSKRIWNFAIMNSAPLSTQDLFLSRNTILEYDVDDIRKEESKLKDFYSEMAPQIIGINVNDSENNMKHLFVEDHLNRIGYDPKTTFTRKQIKNLIPELASTKEGDLDVDKISIMSSMRTEVYHSVGSLVLKNIQENNGIGTLSEDDIKDIFVTEGERIAEFYKDYYKDQLAVWRKEFEELERKEE